MEYVKKHQVITLFGSLFSGAIIRTLPLLLFLVLISVAAQAIQFQNDVDPVKLEFLADSVAKAIINQKEVPGMSIAVAKDGKIVFRKTYGQSDVEMNADVDANTIFGLASITKQFTAATIMQLIEQGEISLEDSITKFLPV